LEHPPGHAQADFAEAIGIIGGVERQIHLFAFNLPHSDAYFVVGYPAETTEAFCDGHVRAFRKASLCEPFSAAEARRLVERFESSAGTRTVIGDSNSCRRHPRLHHP
jgi:hypothetical protein